MSRFPKKYFCKRCTHVFLLKGKIGSSKCLLLTPRRNISLKMADLIQVMGMEKKKEEKAIWMSPVYKRGCNSYRDHWIRTIWTLTSLSLCELKSIVLQYRPKKEITCANSYLLHIYWIYSAVKRLLPNCLYYSIFITWNGFRSLDKM